MTMHPAGLTFDGAIVTDAYATVTRHSMTFAEVGCTQ